MGQHELYDVVIVGARVAGPRGLEALTRAVVDRFAMPQASVQAGLAQGALEIHRKLSKLEAIAAARSLHEIGAIVDVRPSRGESGALVLEPDEQGHAVTLPPAPPFSGGGGDDRDLLTVSRLDSADDLEVPPVRRGTPAAVERGRSASTESDRGAAAMLRAAASNRPRTQPPRPVESRAPEPVRTSEVTRATQVPGAAPRASEPPRSSEPPRAAASARPQTPRPAEPPRGPRATDPQQTLPGPPTRPAPSRPARPSDAPTLDPEAPVLDATALGGGPKPSGDARFAPPVAGERLQLDLAAAGLAKAPVGTHGVSAVDRAADSSGSRPRVDAPGSTRPPLPPRTDPSIPAARLEPVETAPAASSGRFATVPASRSASLPASASMRGQIELAPSRGLLAGDRVVSALLGLALATVIGIVVAYGWVRRDASSTCERLEGELATAVADPIGVAEARVRAPATIVGELDEALGDLRRRFLLVWLAVAAPLGIAGAAIKRPG